MRRTTSLTTTELLIALAILAAAGCGGGGGGDGDAGGANGDGTEALAGFPSGDPARGKVVYETCAACHSLVADPGEVYFGPHLAGIVGREVAADPDFAYSDALRQYGGAWTPERLAAYLQAPEEAVPGTEMVQALPEPQDVADVIAYLRQVQRDQGR